MNTYLVVPNLVTTVVGYKLTSIKGTFPVAYVRPDGSERDPVTFEENYPEFYFKIIIYVRRGGQTDAKAIDRVDAIEAAVAEMCETETTPYQWIGYSERSRLYEVVIGGQDFYREDISVMYKLGVS